MKTILLFVLVFSSPALSLSQNLKSGGKLKPEQAIMDIRHYSITLEVDPDQKYIKGFTEIDLILTQPSKMLLFDLWHGFKINQVWVNGKSKPFQFGEDDLIRIPQELAAGKIKVKVAYEGKPGIAEHAPWTGGFQWEKDEKGNPWIAVTCQSEGGKIFFPCKDHPSDEPNEGADLFLAVPQGLTAAGPGLLISQATKKNKTTFHWKTNYTISNYCLVFNIGKYKKVSRDYTTINGNNVKMDFYVLEEDESKATHELDLMADACRILEKYFGEYPWVKEKIGLCETPHLGMEHQTLIAYGNKFRYTKLGNKDFDWLLVHEFGHEWWANKITNRNWADLWIQEGICSFADALHIREDGGEQEYIKWMQRAGRDAKNKLPIVQADDVDSDQAYHGDIYGKGAFFMHTLRYVMGDDLFFPTLKKFANDPKYIYDNTVTTNDVEQYFSAANGKSLKPLFDLFLRSTDKLEISVRQTDANKYEVQVLNLDFDLPFEIITSSGPQKVVLNKKVTTIISDTLPLIDKDTYYLKKITIE